MRVVGREHCRAQSIAGQQLGYCYFCPRFLSKVLWGEEREPLGSEHRAPAQEQPGVCAGQWRDQATQISLCSLMVNILSCGLAWPEPENCFIHWVNEMMSSSMSASPQHSAMVTLGSTLASLTLPPRYLLPGVMLSSGLVTGRSWGGKGGTKCNQPAPLMIQSWVYAKYSPLGPRLWPGLRCQKCWKWAGLILWSWDGMSLGIRVQTVQEGESWYQTRFFIINDSREIFLGFCYYFVHMYKTTPSDKADPADCPTCQPTGSFPRVASNCALSTPENAECGSHRAMEFPPPQNLKVR